MKVLYLPGVLGSTLKFQEGAFGPLQPVWLDLGAILSGGLASLQLGADGVSPGPLAAGKNVLATEILPPVYGPLARFMVLLGWDVLALGWDWRQSHIAQARALWPIVQAWAAGQPIFIVAHSAGGILARAIYGQMQGVGLDAQLARIVTIGTPHFGSMEPVRMWWRLPTLYAVLSALTQAVPSWPGGPGTQYLDAVLGSMPAWYELTAFAAAGPLQQQFPAQAAQIYQAAFYSGANAFVAAPLLFSAQVAQGQLLGFLPAGRLISIAGYNSRTAYALNQPGDPSTDAGYLYTQAGDGLVTVAQASPPGVPVYQVPVEHGLQPLHPAVWMLLPPLVTQGHL